MIFRQPVVAFLRAPFFLELWWRAMHVDNLTSTSPPTLNSRGALHFALHCTPNGLWLVAIADGHTSWAQERKQKVIQECQLCNFKKAFWYRKSTNLEMAAGTLTSADITRKHWMPSEAVHKCCNPQCGCKLNESSSK
jgi:hypothetical protein